MYPPIEILDSISRLMPAVAQAEHCEHVGLMRRMMGGLCAFGGSGSHRRVQGRIGPGSRSCTACARRHPQLSYPKRIGTRGLRRLRAPTRGSCGRGIERGPFRGAYDGCCGCASLKKSSARLALEAAMTELHRIEDALDQAGERGRNGRELVTASVHSGELTGGPARRAGGVAVCRAPSRGACRPVQ